MTTTNRCNLEFLLISVGEDKDPYVDDVGRTDHGRIYLRHKVSERLSPDRLARFLVNSLYQSHIQNFVSNFSEMFIFQAARRGCRAAAKAGKLSKLKNGDKVIAELAWAPAVSFLKVSQGREYKVFYGSMKIGTLVKEPEGWWFQLWDAIPGKPNKKMYPSLIDARDDIRMGFEGRKLAA